MSFSAAVTAANATPGVPDTILVAAGVHTGVGQVVISDDLTIIGADPATTTIVPTASTTFDGAGGDTRGWFLVSAGNKIVIKNLTFDGAGFDIAQAIRSYGKGSYYNCTFMNIGQPSFGPYYGRGVVTTNASATINACTFRNIGRIHAYFYGPATVGSLVIGCTFQGSEAKMLV